MSVLENLQNFVDTLHIERIAVRRKQTLQLLSDYMRSKFSEDKAIRLNFICTHNSRRSHLAQIWAQTFAYYFGIKNINCYSAGTEATALFPIVVEVLQDCGFRVNRLSGDSNPVYSIKYAENELPVIGFSKRLNDNFNPKSNFCAIMTCSQADRDCPFIAGAEKRILLTFEDPKVFDNTPRETEKYQERNLQIATEMYYLFSDVSKRL